MKRVLRWSGRLAGAFLVLLAAVTGIGMVMAASPDRPEPAAGDAFRVSTFNIGYIRDPEGLPRWERRREAVTAMLKHLDADIVAFQEMETFIGRKFNHENRQLDWILSTVPGYGVAAFGDAENYPSTQPVLFRASRFEMVDQGYFYFSETPDRMFSRSFDGGFDHYASTTTLRDRQTGRELFVINVHTDIRSSVNRIGAARLIGERSAAAISAGKAVILIGDFNAHRNAPILEDIKKTGLAGTDLVLPTAHFMGVPFRMAIDHILHGPGLDRLGEGSVMPYLHKGRWPSDHHAVTAIYRFAN